MRTTNCYLHSTEKLPKKKRQHCLGTPGASFTYFNDGGGGGPSDFFGSEILAKSDFVGSMKDAGIFLGREKKEGFLWLAKKGLRDFLGVCQKISDFFG